MMSLALGGVAGAAPQQAIVLDGSMSAGDIRHLRLGSSALRVDLGEPGFTCPGASYVGLGGIVSVGGTSSRSFAARSDIGTHMTTVLLAQPHLQPASVEGLEDDCDIAASFAAASAWAQQSANDASSLASSTTTCAAQAEITYCDVVAAVEAADIVPPMEVAHFNLPVKPWEANEGGGVLRAASSCYEIQTPLVSWIPVFLDMLEMQLAECEDARADLFSLLAQVGPTLESDDAERIQKEADAALSVAHRAASNAPPIQLHVESIRDDLTLAAAQTACAECSGSVGSIAYAWPSSQTSLDRNTGTLQTVALALEQAASEVEASDPDEAARLGSMATRLLALPTSRLMHLTHAASEGVSDVVVALRSESLPDDGESPLAVLVSREPTGSGNAGMTVVDRHLVHDAWRLIAAILDGSGALPPDDEDDDDDGIRDGLETETGSYVSRSDTGTLPLIRDTDGDLYLDGTERTAGSDPNDASSIPNRLLGGAPLTSLPAAAGLAGLLLAVGMSALGRRR